jgi:hypothetical protein
MGTRKRTAITAITCSALLGGCGGLCSNDTVASVTSPSGAHKAVVFVRDCGATTGWSTQVSILRGSERLQNEGGNTLVVEGKTAITVSWQSASAVTLSGLSNGRLFKQERSVNGIAVTYE